MSSWLPIPNGSLLSARVVGLQTWLLGADCLSTLRIPVADTAEKVAGAWGGRKWGRGYMVHALPAAAV